MKELINKVGEIVLKLESNTPTPPSIFSVTKQSFTKDSRLQVFYKMMWKTLQIFQENTFDEVLF